MSDYLANLAAKSINHSQGVRFLVGELRPRLASRFEPPFASAAAWPESPPLVEEVTEHESNASEVPPTPPLTDLDLPEREHHPALSINPLSTRHELESPAGEIPSSVARVIEGIRPISTGQDRPGEQPAHYGEKNGSPGSENEPAHRVAPQAQPASLTTSASQSGVQSPPRRPPSTKTVQTSRETSTTPPEVVLQVTAGRVLDGTQSFRVEQQSLPEQSNVEPAARDQPAEPQHVNQRRDMQQPGRRQPAAPLSPRLAAANAAVQVENAITNGAIPSQMPASGQNLSVLQSILARLGEPRHEAEPRPAPTVNVTIGRIEVRATPPPPVSTPKPRPMPVMTLEEYLRRRATGGGS